MHRQCGSRERLETVSHGLYAGLRRYLIAHCRNVLLHNFMMTRVLWPSFDHTKVDVIFAEGFEDVGLGSAIMNRLMKAAGNAVLIETHSELVCEMKS